MTTHNHQDDELLTPEDSSSAPISNSSPEDIDQTVEDAVTAEAEQSSKRPTVSLSQGPPHATDQFSVTSETSKTPKPLLGLALFTSGISLGALGCGITLAKGPFADLASYLEPLAQRGLTGGSMILTGMVLTAMSIVERQLRKQTQAMAIQESNSSMLQDIFGAMASINTRFDALTTNGRQVYAEANMMRNELHQHVTNQEGKDEQTGIFHVAASVDKLNANVDQSLKRFGSDLERKLAAVREESQAINQKLEAKLQELEPQELPDNSELIAAQADVAERIQSLESDLQSTRAQMREVGDCVQTNVQTILEEKLSELQPQETYDDTAVLAGQSELSDRLCTMEENIRTTQDCVGSLGESLQSIPTPDPYDDSAMLAGQSEVVDRLCSIEQDLRSTQEHVSGLGQSVQNAVDESMQSIPTPEAYDDSAMLAGQSEVVDRLCAIEQNLRSTQEQVSGLGECVQNAVDESMQTLPTPAAFDDSAMLAGQSELTDRLCAMEENLRSAQAEIGECVQSAVQESIQGLPQQEARDDSAILESQSVIASRLNDLEGHLESTRERFSEVQEAVQCSADNLSQSVQESVDGRIEELRVELEQVCNTVESAVQSALENMPSPQPISFESVVQDTDTAQIFLTSEPGVQTWPLSGPRDQPSGHRVQESEPLEILHMPTEEEMAAAIDVEQEQLAHSLDHLFHPISPEQEKSLDVAEELFLDNIPQPHDSNQDSSITPEGPTPFLSSAPNLIPGTPGSPFPAPVPLQPTDSDDDVDPPTESSSEFQNPYEPPSDDTGFRFPGWN